MTDLPNSFACQFLGDPPKIASISFDTTTLVSYDEVQKTGDELFSLQLCASLQHLVVQRVTKLSNDEQHPATSKPSTVKSFALTRPSP